MRKKNLLIDEYPLLVLPSLAIQIGLNEAIALQQIHYWLQNPKGGEEIDGERWVYNTYEEWQRDNFPFWSVRTVQRVFASLESMELVISMQKAAYDRSKYYRIHYDKLSSWNMPDCHNAEFQNGTIEDDNLASSSLTETTETTPDLQEVIDSANKKVDEYLKLAQAPGLKREARIDSILSYIGGKLRINTETKRWKEFAKFVDNRQREFNESIETFIKWLVGQKNFDIQYWSPLKMMEMWPQAFTRDLSMAGEESHEL